MHIEAIRYQNCFFMTAIILQIIAHLQQSRKFSELNGVDLLILHGQEHAAEHFIGVGDTSE